jgi:hypothetical protein
MFPPLKRENAFCTKSKKEALLPLKQVIMLLYILTKPPELALYNSSNAIASTCDVCGNISKGVTLLMI